MFTWIGFYRGKRVFVQADDEREAREKAAALFRISNPYLVAIALSDKQVPLWRR